jgi:hypothetical protein
MHPVAPTCLLQSHSVANNSNRNRDEFRKGAHNAKGAIRVCLSSAAVGAKIVSDSIFDMVGGNLARRCVELPSRFSIMSRENGARISESTYAREPNQEFIISRVTT